MKNNVLKGSILVALAATSYGMLATFVKMAYGEGFSTGEVTLSQYTLGVIGLIVLTLFRKRGNVQAAETSGLKGRLKLVVAGTSMGLTSVFYYLSVQYIPVSVGIVLLMQAVWMGVVVDMILFKKRPGARKLLAVLIILTGTILATGVFGQSVSLNWTGIGWGIMAAVCYTATMYSSNNLEVHFPPLKRSLYLILGGLAVVTVIFHSALTSAFSFEIFTHWGVLLSVFGTILPPLLFTRGMPLTGVGLGAIIASVEIPVSVLMASLLLNEPVSFLQWAGVILILSAVVLMNFKKKEL